MFDLPFFGLIVLLFLILFFLSTRTICQSNFLLDCMFLRVFFFFMFIFFFILQLFTNHATYQVAWRIKHWRFHQGLLRFIYFYFLIFMYFFFFIFFILWHRIFHDWQRKGFMHFFRRVQLWSWTLTFGQTWGKVRRWRTLLLQVGLDVETHCTVFILFFGTFIDLDQVACILYMYNFSLRVKVAEEDS